MGKTHRPNDYNPDGKIRKRITGVPEYYVGDVERLVKFLRAMEEAPADTHTDSAHRRAHKQCRRLFQDLLETDY